MADVSVATIPAGAVDLAHAAYLYDLIIAGRVSDGQKPLEFPHARRLVLKAPSTNAGSVFLTKDPKSTAIGKKLIADAVYEEASGGGTNNQSILGWYIYGNVGDKLEVTQEY